MAFYFVLKLTRGSLPIVPRIYISFALSPFGSWNFLHTVDLRNAQLRIKRKVHFPLLDRQIVMVPVPQLLQIVVIKHIKRIIPRRKFLKENISFNSSPIPMKNIFIYTNFKILYFLSLI